MEILAGIAAVLALGIATYLTIWLLILLPADMARARNRSPLARMRVSLFGSPFPAIFLLWFFEDA